MRIKQKTIQATKQGEMFICPICNKEKKYSCLGLCRTCYNNELYQSSEKVRENKKLRCKKQWDKGYFRKRYYSNKVGNMDNIEKLCLEHGYSKDVANAIAMDGVELDKEMEKRGIIPKGVDKVND